MSASMDNHEFKTYLLEIPSDSTLRSWKNILRQIKYIEKNNTLPAVTLSITESDSSFIKDQLEIVSRVVDFIKAKGMYTNLLIDTQVKQHHLPILSKVDGIIVNFSLNDNEVNEEIAGLKFFNGISITNSSYSKYIDEMSEIMNIHSIHISSMKVKEVKIKSDSENYAMYA